MIVFDPAEAGVSALMTHDPIVVVEDAALAVAAELFDAYGVSGAPVVDLDGEVVGVVSATDLVRVRGETLSPQAWHTLRVRDIMTRPAITIGADATVAEAARLMTTRHVHRLIVVDDTEEPVGVISETDLVREMAAACDLD